ncbi:hypothetical protein IW261DRAFT_1457440 [Armillaria novae-zelandiae]|uniref:Secreted protein n=1 Tax=Armillaria novae-zelandiae TaxID=153914 RepID=A0AA39PIZ4_9AGAR|nr:hypothetical protein IW261DRAFT_1457440 [Armillaria novae-zelandiae]
MGLSESMFFWLDFFILTLILRPRAGISDDEAMGTSRVTRSFLFVQCPCAESNAPALTLLWHLDHRAVDPSPLKRSVSSSQSRSISSMFPFCAPLPRRICCTLP